MNKVIATISATLVLAAASEAALGGNRSFTGVYSGDEPTMPGAPSSCNPAGAFGYQEHGVFQVDQTGDYKVAEASNIGFSGFGGVQDSSALIYSGSFDAANPNANLVAAVDVNADALTESDLIGLSSGTDYVLVVQHWCTQNAYGPWAVVIDGPGDFSGAGFDTSGDTFGDYAAINTQAAFNVGNAGGNTYKYVVSRTFSPDASGLYGFVSIGDFFGGAPSAILIYDGDFNAANTSANFLADLGFEGTIVLDADQTYTVVLLDAFETDDPFQYVIYSAGEPGMTTALNGAWAVENAPAQGILMQYGPNTFGGLLFMAWFTFESGGAQTSAVTGPSTKAVGAGDQRWLTAVAAGGRGDSEVDLAFENSTGGAFNASTPAANTNSSYGTGTLTIESCESMVIDYLLPDESGAAVLVPAFPQETESCFEQTGVGPLTQ